MWSTADGQRRADSNSSDNGERLRLATGHNARTIRANWAVQYVRPEADGRPSSHNLAHVDTQEPTVREPDLCTDLCTRRDGTG
jgi:hypothetical protein